MTGVGTQSTPLGEIPFPFPTGEISSVVGKGRWVVLRYFLAKDILVLMLIPLIVKEDQYWCLVCLGNYSFNTIKAEYFPIYALLAMKYG